MKDKDQIIEGLLQSKAQLLASRRMPIAAIEKELNDLRNQLNHRLDDLLKSIDEVNDIKEK